MDVANESREAQESQQAEDLCEADNPQGARRLVEIWVDARLHDEEDVVHRDGGDEVHHKPTPQVLDLDLLRIQDDLRVVLFDDTRPEVEDQVHEEEGVGDHVEHDPGGRVLVLEERDAHRDDDEVAHHQQQHGQVPVKPCWREKWRKAETGWWKKERWSQNVVKFSSQVIATSCTVTG